MLRRIVTYFFIFLSVCSSKLQATNHFQQFSKYTTEHGLANNTILSICQDASGIMWFGTTEGLSRYNGSEFTSYSCQDSLLGYSIYFIAQADSCMLILGTSTGSVLFNTKDQKCYPLSLSKSSNIPIKALFKIHGRVYLGSEAGVFELDIFNKSGKLVNENSISCAQIAPDGKIYLGTNGNGVLQVHEQEKNLLLQPIFPALNAENIRSIQFQKNGTPVVLSGKGLWLTSNQGLHLAIPGNFSSITISQEGRLLLGTLGDFIQLVQQDGKHFHLKDYISRNNSVFNDYYDAQVLALYRDYSGCIWIGTHRAGLDKIDRKKLTYTKYKSTTQVPEAGYINAITLSTDGKIWIGTSGKGLHLLDIKKQKLIPFSIPMEDGKELYIEALLQYENYMYIGTRSHGTIIAEYPSTKPNELKVKSRLHASKIGLDPNDCIYNLKRFSNQLYICSSKGTFAYNFSTKGVRKVDNLPSINIDIDTLQNQWILTYSMQLFLNGDRIEIDAEVSDLLLSDHICAWAATAKGLAYIDGKTQQTAFYNPPGKVIEFTSIRKGEQGDFWLGSRMGIYRFNPQSKTFGSYQIPGGSKANSFNHGKLLQTPKGEFFWGSNDGVVSITPSENVYLPEPQFEIEAKNQNVLSVHNLSYNHQAENAIAYRFTHPDSSWHQIAGTQTTLDFSTLTKGAQLIEVTAINADGVMNPNSKSFRISPMEQSKESQWMWLFLLLAMLGLGWFIWNQKRKQSSPTSELEPEDETASNLPLETPEDKLYREWMQDEFMQMAIRIIEKQLSNNSFGVNELYAEMKMSKSNFYRKLKMTTDLSPNELIRFIRLRKSTQFLIEAKLSVNEIAYEVGFNTPSYFTRCFKQQFGIAPSEYKEHYDNLCCATE